VRRGDAGTWDSRTWGRWNSGTWDARTLELGDARGLEEVINKLHLTFGLNLKNTIFGGQV